MTTETTARTALAKALEAFDVVFRTANGLTTGAPQAFKGLLPDIDYQRLTEYRNWIDPTINAPLKNAEGDVVTFADLVKSDFSAVYGDHGRLEFKAFDKIAKLAPSHDPKDKKSRKHKALRLFTYPRAGDKAVYADYGTTISMDVSAFSLYYDFRNSGDTAGFYVLRLENISLEFEFHTPKKNSKQLERLFATPPFAVDVEIKIPVPLGTGIAIPDISIGFFEFRIDLNLNFPTGNINWSPLSFVFPDWLDWPFGSLDFGDLFGSSLNCDCLPAFAGPGWFKGWAGIDFGSVKVFFLRLGDLLGFGGSSIDSFTHKQPDPKGSRVPEWVAIYFNLTKLSASILGGFAPEQLHLLLGIDSSGQVKAGFLATSDALGLADRSVMLQSGVFVEFEVKTDDSAVSNAGSITAHPGFTIEVLSGAKFLELAQKAKAVPPLPSKTPPPAAEMSFGNALVVRADRIDLGWDKPAEAYVFSISGQVTIKELLRDGATGADLVLPFKKLGVTTDGRFVLGDSWVTLPKALQVKLDDFAAVVLFLRGYGYGKEATGDFWIGFSGDLRLPVLGLEAGVDRLVIRSDGDVELSGVRIDLEVAKVLALKGAVAWGEGLSGVPNLQGASVDGFGGQLTLGIKAIPLDLGLGMTYVKVEVPPDEEFVAWSFYLQVPLPVVVPICFCLGLSSVGLLVGQNYLPKAKMQGLPTNEWLDKGLNGDVENLLDVPKSWGIQEGAFAAGFEVGIASTADNGYIINAKAILVLVVPGPLVMIAGKANILSKTGPSKSGAIDLLIVYDHADPGIMVSLAFGYKIKALVSISGMAEIYFSFTDAGDWHFYLGTPQKQIGGHVLGIFEARAYLTIDPKKLAAGAMVFYGKKWTEGPVRLKCYVSFSAEITIGWWEPKYIEAKIGIVGEIGLTVFGFGLEASLSADLAVRAPDPWYLLARAEARFRISFFFFSWSFTATLEFSWGSPALPPDVQLPLLSSSEKRFELTASASQSHTSLVTDNPGNQTGDIPMDGVLGLRFLRDIEIDSTGANFPKLEGTTPISIRDEKSPEAGNVTRFHGKLTSLEVRKSTNGGPYQPVTRGFHFDWTPLDEVQRKKLAVRDFDLGYSQFRLNDDPNASVTLTCPAFYETHSALLFGIDQSLHEAQTGRFALQSSVVLDVEPPGLIEQRLTTNAASAAADFIFDYAEVTAELSCTPVIGVDRTVGTNVIVRPGFEIEFSVPAAAVTLSFQPDAAVAGGRASDFVTLYDEHGVDMTEHCLNHLIVDPSGGYVMCLNDFDGALVSSAKQFSTQRPPRRGVERIVVKRNGRLRHFAWQHTSLCLAAMIPQEMVEDIHRRNIERLEQRANLDYVFGQNKDPGKLLWEPGDYRVTAKTVWDTDAGDLEPSVNTTPGPPAIKYDFTVILPFEEKSAVVNGETVAVQSFEGYVRRLVPANGQRPVYRHQHPVVTYGVNYVNAMLQRGKRRLAMVLADANGDPLTYTRQWLEVVAVEPSLHADLSHLSRRSTARQYRGVLDLVERMGDVGVAVDADELVTVLQKGGLVPEATPDTETDHPTGGLRVRRVRRHDLVGEARSLTRRRDRWAKDPARQRAIDLRETIEKHLSDKSDGALVVEWDGGLILVRVRSESKVAEYRYTNDDLALDVSSLDLSDCLGTGPRKLNAYERGYFAPVIPSDGVFGGPKPLTAYTAKIYCLGENADLEQYLAGGKPVLTTPFTSSAFPDPDALGVLFDKCKVRDVKVGLDAYRNAVSYLDDTTAPAAIAHPGVTSVDLHTGADIFRELAAAPAVDENGKTPRQVEEKHQELYDLARSDIDDDRAAESLLLDDIAESLGVLLEPTSPRRIVATWLRTDEAASGTAGTMGLVIEFPEPVDWDRMAISIDRFDVDLDGQVTDLLTLETLDPRYEIALHWIRSKDGTRILLLPEITITTVVSPRIAGLDPARPGAFATGRADLGDLTQSTDLARHVSGPGHLEPSGGVEPQEAALRGLRRLGDVSVASTTGANRETHERLGRRYGRSVTSRVTRYEPRDLRLDFYYLSDNHESGSPNAKTTYRAIPRLRFRSGVPGDANGRIGTLVPLAKGASS